MENKIDWSRTDGLIFDMDGTLWDAVDTYARIWNEVFLRAGKEVHITRESLIGNTVSYTHLTLPTKLEV